MKNLKIGIGITGSFCTHKQILNEIKSLVKSGHTVLPILSFASTQTDTRFGTAQELITQLTEITGNTPITTLPQAEPVGPNNLIDVLVIAPCTGNTLAKLASAVTDSPVTMVAKAISRNYKPVVLGISTNDGLGLNMQNIAKLMATKNTFFVPFGQDDPVKKPKSLIADFALIEETVNHAIKGEQIQPILLK